MSGAAEMFMFEGEEPHGAPLAPKRLPRQSPPRVFNDAVERIVEAVAPHFGVTKGEVFSEVKSRSVAKARSIAMHVSRHRYQHSHPELGRFFGRDQSSCGASLRGADRILAEDRSAADLVRRLLEQEGAIR